LKTKGTLIFIDSGAILFIAFALTVAASIVGFVLEGRVLRLGLPSTSLFPLARLLLIPILIAALPFAFARLGRRAQAFSVFGSGLLLLLWDILTGFSVGVFYLPATVAMGVAAAVGLLTIARKPVAGK